MKKAKPEPTFQIPTFAARWTNVPPCTVDIRELEYFNADGDPGYEIFKCEGCRLAPNVVMFRRLVEAFRIYLKLGEHWYAVLVVNMSDPAIQQLRDDGVLIRYGLAPHEQERERKRQAEIEAREQRNREYAESRQRAAAERVRRAGEARQRVRDENRTRMGLS